MQKPPQVSKIIFQKYDKDGCGSIDISDFRNLCYELGHFLPDQNLEFALKMMDKNGDGRIEYDEFLKWWSQNDKFGKLELKEDQRKKIEVASNYFRYFDKDNSGSIEKSEFNRLHADLVKNKLTTKDLESCLKDLDENSDGRVEFNEYIDWLIRIGSLPIDMSF